MQLRGLLARHYLKFLLGLVGVAVIVIAIVFIRSASLEPEPNQAAGSDESPVVENAIPDAQAAEPQATNENSNSSGIASGNGAAVSSVTKIVNSVKAKDAEKPVVTLTGPVEINMDLGSAYIERGATWTDNVDGSGAAIIGGDIVDVNKIGSYTITYDYTDKAGNIADQKVRLVFVVDAQKPEIKLVGGPEVTVSQYSDYIDPGATAIDNCDGGIQSKIVVGNLVNTNILGDYTVTYDVTDDSGNKADQISRLVHVTADHSLDNVIESNFETGLQGWIGDATLTDGNDSRFAMRMTNSAPESEAFAKKVFSDKAPLAGYDKIEFDINLHGNSLVRGELNDGAALAFDQDGWKFVNLLDYVKDGFDGWQHIQIPLADFEGLDTNANIGYVGFKFWNYTSGNYDIDNIGLIQLERPDAPTSLAANVVSDTEVNLSWSGSGVNFAIYQNGTKIGQTSDHNYLVSSLTPSTDYSFYVTANNGQNDSDASSSVSARTMDLMRLPISNFENGMDDWIGGLLGPGFNSNNGMRLSVAEPDGGSTGATKTVDGDLARGFAKVEFDINLNGNLIAPDDSAMFAFEQSGEKKAPLANYSIVSGSTEWQHVVIPFSSIDGFDPNAGFAWMKFRFWNGQPGDYDIDNIVFSK